MKTTVMPRGFARLNQRVFQNTGLVSGCACVSKERMALEQRLRSQLHNLRVRRASQRFLARTLVEFQGVLQAKKLGSKFTPPRTILAHDLAECLGVYHYDADSKKSVCAQYNFVAGLILWFNVRVQRMRPELSKETNDLQNFLMQK